MSDNKLGELDETFDNPNPVVNFKMPELLTQSELLKLNELTKTKSNKELTNLVLDISIKNNQNLDDMQKMQLLGNLTENISIMSKRELINTLGQIVNQSNKKLVFEDASELKTMTSEHLTRKQLCEKLHQKQMMQNKNKMQQIMEEFGNEQIKETPLTENNEKNQQIQLTNKKKKNKKKKKANQIQLHDTLSNKMSELLQTNPI